MTGTNNQEVGKSQNQEPKPGTLFLVGSWFLAGRFGFGLPLKPIIQLIRKGDTVLKQTAIPLSTLWRLLLFSLFNYLLFSKWVTDGHDQDNILYKVQYQV